MSVIGSTRLAWCASLFAAVMLIVGTITLVTRRIDTERLRARLEAVEAERGRLAVEARAAERSVARLSEQAESVAQSIAAELGEKHQIHLAMAQVMARARLLQQERSRFEELRTEVEKRLRDLESQRAVAQQSSPNIGLR